MNILRDVARELLKMFLADARLSLSILALVLLVAFLIKAANIDPLAAGAILLAGNLGILVYAVNRHRRK